MRRHVLVGRMGPLDKIAIAKAGDEVLTELPLVNANRRLGFGIGKAIEDLVGVQVFPTEVGLDLLVLAAHVHAADTRIARASESQDGWTREIRLVVPVSDLARWAAAAPLIDRMLRFLTGDHWTVGFRVRPAGFAQLIPRRLAKTPTPIFDRVNLFSGGLDSLIGAIDALAAGATPLLVSHAGEGAVSDSQERCYDGLLAEFGEKRLARLRVWMNFPTDLVKNVLPENSTRGRSFLFFAAAAFAASGLPGLTEINVPENGFIALNVPLDPLRLGSLSTRTTHPFYIARWNELLVAAGFQCALRNPYWDQTKGEMVKACSNSKLLKALVPKSLSCSSPTKGRWQGHAAGHCGYCLPCLIRRAALHPADPTSYTLSLRSGTLYTDTAEGQQVRSFQVAVNRVAANPKIAPVLIHTAGPLADEAKHLDRLADIYRRGLNEVGVLLKGVTARPR